jgi:hypothetical protein
LSTASDK